MVFLVYTTSILFLLEIIKVFIIIAVLLPSWEYTFHKTLTVVNESRKNFVRMNLCRVLWDNNMDGVDVNDDINNFIHRQAAKKMLERI